MHVRSMDVQMLKHGQALLPVVNWPSFGSAQTVKAKPGG